MTTTSSIDLTAIEQELRQLWKESAADALSEGRAAVTRALTLNLVARARDGATAERISASAQALTASHPNRTVLVIEHTDDPSARLEAYVQANCLLTAPGAPQVCGEQVTIDAGAGASGQVASLVLPLLVPDLPVALWMPGPAPFADPLLGRLRGVIDRLIVDSADFLDPTHDLRRMAELDRAGGSAVSDLSWTRLTPWRELLAQFFDTRPLLPHLRRVDHVEIGFASAAEHTRPLDALLLAGWLIASLGWSLLADAVSVEGDRIRLHVRRPAVGVGPSAIRLVTFDLIGQPAAPGAAAGIRTLRLQALDNVRASFSVEQTADPTCVRTVAQVDDLAPISRMARVAPTGLPDLLAAELRLLSRDRTFSGALQVAGGIAERIG